MPTLNIQENYFNTLTNNTYTFEKLHEIFFEFGIQVQKAQEKNKDTISTIYKFDCMNNRPDLLSTHSLIRAIQIYEGKIDTPIIKLSEPTTCVYVDSSVKRIRPYIYCCILRNVSFDQKSYRAFLDSQEKLHQTFCRQRKFASIGTHDLDTLKGPFHYVAKDPKDFKFIPLYGKQQMDGHEMMAFLQSHKLKEYLHLIKDSPLYPLVLDSNGVVGSVPPIINSQHSKLSLQTKNVLIEVTATDKHKASICLNTLIWGFSEICQQKFEVEPVTIIDGNQKFVTPNLDSKKFIVLHENAETMVGNKLNSQQILSYLKRSGLKGSIINKDKYEVQVPFWRTDILHECDIIEDIAICYGYTKIVPKAPKSATCGNRVRLNKFADQVRHVAGYATFNEVLNFALCSKADLTTNLLSKDEKDLITIENARTKQFQTGRTTLLPGLIKTIVQNRSNPLPYKLFEVGDCILKDPQSDTGAKNEKRIGMVITDEVTKDSKVSLFAMIHGSLDYLLQKSNLKFGTDYTLSSIEEPHYFKGQQFAVHVKGARIGSIGIVHPQVIEKFGWNHPIAALEVNLEMLEQYYTQSFK